MVETEHWRRTLEEEWVAVVAVCLIVVAGGLAAAAYWGYEPDVAFGVGSGMLAAAGLIVAGAILFADVLRDSAISWIDVE